MGFGATIDDNNDQVREIRDKYAATHCGTLGICMGQTTELGAIEAGKG